MPDDLQSLLQSESYIGFIYIWDEMGNLLRCGRENTDEGIESLKAYSAVTDFAATSHASDKNIG